MRHTIKRSRVRVHFVIRPYRHCLLQKVRWSAHRLLPDGEERYTFSAATREYLLYLCQRYGRDHGYEGVNIITKQEER